MDDNLKSMIAMAEKDYQSFELKRLLKGIPERLTDAGRQLNAEEQILLQHETPWSELENAIREKEATILVALETIDKFEAHMKLVKTQKEYMAAKKQVEDARKLNNQLQEDILEARMKQEELSGPLNEIRGHYKRVKETFEAEEKSILAEQERMQGEIAALEGEMSGYAATVNNNLMRHYKRLADGGKMPAIARVEQGNCMGCNMMLPPQDYNQLIANPGEFRTCSNCSRIVYYRPPEEEEEVVPGLDSPILEEKSASA